MEIPEKSDEKFKNNLIKKIKTLKNDILNSNIEEVYKNFLIKSADLFLIITGIDKNNEGDYYKKMNFESLLIENNDLYRELLPENYGKCYVNPEYCVKLFGAKNGLSMSMIYSFFRSLILDAFMHRASVISEYSETLMRLSGYLMDSKEITADKLTEIEKSLALDKLDEKKFIEVFERFDPRFDFYKEIINSATEKDLRYLFRYGRYISYNEIKAAHYIGKMPAGKISALAKHINNAYLEGFTTENKDRKGRNFVKIMPCAGYERIIKAMIADFNKKGFEVIISSVFSTNPNRQAGYDHRYDEKPLLCAEYNELIKNAYQNAYSKFSGALAKYSGHIVIRNFGETPFSPVEKKQCRALNKTELGFYNKLGHDMSDIFFKNVPDAHTSFSMISFPTPEIGDNYDEIFEEILSINTLDTNKCMLIQQKIIDAFDRAGYVHIKGCCGNMTDIRVNMPKLKDPKKHTNFYNCGADVNIPAGEVFTTPMLKGTDGVLHVKEAYLDGFNYIDLVLKFKDGVVSDYSCKNFKTAAENKKYIEQNLFHLEKNLPIGEFAIGTNTLAYAAAKKYGILKKLPILITEKMGPHFAIGDSCYVHVEDLPIYNRISNKEITARDNERSILRKTNLSKAYTYVHVDITLPYEFIGFITAAGPDKKNVKIIENGRFVLAGCETLNGPLEGEINQ